MNPLLPHPAEIVEKHSFWRDIHAYRMVLRDPSTRPLFDFRPGQFNMVYVPGVGEVAISISSDPEDEPREAQEIVGGGTIDYRVRNQH